MKSLDIYIIYVHVYKLLVYTFKRFFSLMNRVHDMREREREREREMIVTRDTNEQ